MKKRYYISMFSIYLLMLIFDCIYFISHKSPAMFLSMTIPNLIAYGFVNLIGAYFLYKPIDQMLTEKKVTEKSKRRINTITLYSSVWIFFVGIFSGFVLLIGVFLFDIAAEVATMDNMPSIFFIAVIPSTIHTMAVLPAFIAYFLINDFTLDLKARTFQEFDIRFSVGRKKMGLTLFFILFIFGFFPVLVRALDLAATSTVSLEEYNQLISISYIETTLNEQFILLAAMIFAVIFIPRTFTKPIYALLQEINKVGQGDYSTRAAILAEDEIGILTDNFNNMVKELQSSYNKLEEYSHTLEKNLEQLNKEIVEREQAEKLAKEQQLKLFQAEKMASVGTMVSGVAHEINNPNNFILLNGENLSDVWQDLLPFLDKYAEENGDFMIAGLMYSEIRDEVSMIINGIKEGSERIKKIVLTLKDFARKDPGNLDQMVEIPAVIDDAVTILAGMIKKSTDRFSMDLADDLPAIKGNIQQIEQVIINLISNSCHALQDRSKKIEITAAVEEDSMTIIVKDEGSGISAEDLKYIMDPFFTTKRNSGGTGLGLSISYNIIKDHGGELVIDSEIDKGTTSIIKLPV